MDNRFLFILNGTSAPWERVPDVEFPEFHAAVLEKMTSCRLEAFFALPENESSYKLVIVLGDPAARGFLISSCRVTKKFASFTAECPAFNRFEREIFETHGIFPENHPWLKPLRFTQTIPGVTDYFTMSGEAVHEVAVGPVHAGVIEPGHFRFECMGEDVFSLEISLGYQHRGVEKMLIGAPDARTACLIETAAGDTSIAAALNYSRIIETLGSLTVTPEAEKVRQIALELERCANHIGDLGALAGDVAFLPTASFCGRIRGEYLNMSAELCGNRFGRSFILPGGVRYPLEKARAEKISAWLSRVAPELWDALDLMFESPTVLDRFENTGSVSKKIAADLGLIGVAGRASGLDCDARRDFPIKGVDSAVPAPANGSGDVLARAKIRCAELKLAHEYLFAALRDLSCDAVARHDVSLKPDHIAISVTEAWRGELCHVAITGNDGKFRICKIVDPSFHNWEGLAMALRGEQISHFPICNKSFNLSYCGHDL